MTLATIVHEPARSTGLARPGLGVGRPTRGRPSAAPTVVVTLRLALGDRQDPVAALAELVDRLGDREAPPSAPVWLARVEHAAIQPGPDTVAEPAIIQV